VAAGKHHEDWGGGVRVGAHICSFVTGGPWRYQGFYFEFHHVCGPTPLKQNGDPSVRQPSKAFWEMWERFDRLSPQEKKSYEAR
jgi:hypothetical protein